jgi:hypothetical protein
LVRAPKNVDRITIRTADGEAGSDPNSPTVLVYEGKGVTDSNELVNVEVDGRRMIVRKYGTGAGAGPGVSGPGIRTRRTARVRPGAPPPDATPSATPPSTPQ